MVDEMLAPSMSRVKPRTIVDRDDVRVELVDQVVGLQRGDHSAGGHIDVHAEARAVHRMDFR